MIKRVAQVALLDWEWNWEFRL